MFNKRFLEEALTRFNYFPNQKQGQGELSPYFKTRSFTPEITMLLSKLTESKEREKGGYDLVEYRSTRYNNVPRILSILHPRPYSSLVRVFADNFVELEGISANERSMIRPECHTDGRLIIMNYDDTETRANRESCLGFAKKFRVHADIAHCFGSIYTHAIEWAVQGLDVVKANRSSNSKTKKGNHWSALLDKAQSKCRRNETQGIPIGPATSSIVSELILKSIDDELVDDGFKHIRYVDDYTCFCETHEEAQRFLHKLDIELRKLRLSLNMHKTSIVELPEPLSDGWVSELMLNFPSVFIDSKGESSSISINEALHFLDYSVRLNKKTPDGSVLKYAVSSLVPHVHVFSECSVFNYLINLCWYYPILLPYLEKVSAKSSIFKDERCVDSLNKIVQENAVCVRSDGMAWGLYYLHKFRGRLDKETILCVIKAKDCLSLTLLARFPKAREKVISCAKNIMDSNVLHKKDNFWLLLYELFRAGWIKDPYSGDNTFSLLKKYDVRFIHGDDRVSEAEKYSKRYFNPVYQAFGDKNSIPKFEDYYQHPECREKGDRLFLPTLK